MSFTQLVDDTRHKTAFQLLTETSHPLTEVAFMLGFSEQSAVSRAARKWFASPPAACASGRASKT